MAYLEEPDFTGVLHDPTRPSEEQEPLPTHTEVSDDKLVVYADPDPDPPPNHTRPGWFLGALYRLMRAAFRTKAIAVVRKRRVEE